MAQMEMYYNLIVQRNPPTQEKWKLLQEWKKAREAIG